jgi:hypothetical protein
LEEVFVELQHWLDDIHTHGRFQYYSKEESVHFLLWESRLRREFLNGMNNFIASILDQAITGVENLQFVFDNDWVWWLTNPLWHVGKIEDGGR